MNFVSSARKLCYLWRTDMPDSQLQTPVSVRKRGSRNPHGDISLNLKIHSSPSMPRLFPGPAVLFIAFTEALHRDFQAAIGHVRIADRAGRRTQRELSFGHPVHASNRNEASHFHERFALQNADTLNVQTNGILNQKLGSRYILAFRPHSLLARDRRGFRANFLVTRDNESLRIPNEIGARSVPRHEAGDGR